MAQHTLQDVGLELARLRREKGLTQHALAEMAGVARSTLAKVEVGQLSDFGVRKLLNILSAMDCSLTLHRSEGASTLDDLRRERGASG
jgi:transcriptional regulator with XRE-family HTH domain